MKSLTKVLLPAIIIFAGYRFLGMLLGTVIMLAVLSYIVVSRRADIYVILGKASYQKDNNRMFSAFERAYKTGKMTPEQKIYYGYMCMREGRLERAEELFGAVLAFKQKPEIMAQARLNNALLLWKKGNLDEAIQITEGVYNEYKTSVVYGNLGYLLIEKGDLKRALEFNREAYEYNDTNNVICDNLAQTYYLMGEYEKSREIYEKMMTRDINSPTPHYNYAKTLMQTGDFTGAAEHLKKALELPFSGVATIDRESVEKLLCELENRAGDFGAEIDAE